MIPPSLTFSVLLLIAASGSLPITSQAETTSREWQYLSPDDIPESVGGLQVSLSSSEKTPDGSASLECTPHYNIEEVEWPSTLTYQMRGALVREAKTFSATFWIKGPAATHISVRITDIFGAVRYTDTKSYELTGDWQQIVFEEHLKTGPITGKWITAPRILFDDAKTGQRFIVGPVSFSAAK